ncbi:5'-methylthioadenosine/S-adenosylhomocysteine nucleosidase [Schaalia vaccimaxillae]|uniref:5'-methylthioadenosine/S-adenosylhomocysteine nucleosidase n=1 Tax=Schaalia vaccimaxillae TaxID=183916 RepID=UPI0003B30950|nr:5'-methylthioadenosine/S-adenosylhomocysteine nucleosidase [Schaalia vaccimaxillae]
MTTINFPERIRVEAVIQAAMDMEAKPLLDALEPLEGEETPQVVVAGKFGHAVQRFILGMLDGHKVLVVTSGIGLANGAAAAARALALVDTPIFIAAGTTGGLAHDIEVGDIAGGISTVYGQADATAFGYSFGQVPQMPADYNSSEAAVGKLGRLGAHVEYTVRSGQILSSDSFATEQVADPLRAQFPKAIGSDMETCAMAQVAWSAGVDWISLRAVSDLCGPGADQQFHMDGERAAQHSADAVRAFLNLED